VKVEPTLKKFRGIIPLMVKPAKAGLFFNHVLKMGIVEYIAAINPVCSFLINVSILKISPVPAAAQITGPSCIKNSWLRSRFKLESLISSATIGG
jgi:hypothetical protein